MVVDLFVINWMRSVLNYSKIITTTSILWFGLTKLILQDIDFLTFITYTFEKCKTIELRAKIPASGALVYPPCGSDCRSVLGRSSTAKLGSAT